MNFATEQTFIFIKVAVGYDICVTSKTIRFYDFWCMKSWGNLTAENYKFAHLTCILWPHYLEKCKSHFNSVIHMCFWMFRLLPYWTKWITTVTMQLSGRSLVIESVGSDLPLRGHNYGVCHTTVRSPNTRCSAGIHSMTQPAAAATRPQSTFRGTRSCIMPKMR